MDTNVKCPHVNLLHAIRTDASESILMLPDITQDNLGLTGKQCNMQISNAC